MDREAVNGLCHEGASCLLHGEEGNHGEALHRPEVGAVFVLICGDVDVDNDTMFIKDIHEIFIIDCARNVAKDKGFDAIRIVEGLDTRGKNGRG